MQDNEIIAFVDKLLFYLVTSSGFVMAPLGIRLHLVAAANSIKCVRNTYIQQGRHAELVRDNMAILIVYVVNLLPCLFLLLSMAVCGYLVVTCHDGGDHCGITIWGAMSLVLLGIYILYTRYETKENGVFAAKVRYFLTPA